MKNIKKILMGLLATFTVVLLVQAANLTRTLTWDDPNPVGTIDLYCIYQGQITGTTTNWNKIATTTTKTYPLSLVPGSWNLYIVTGSNVFGETDFSNVAGGWTPTPVKTKIIQ